MALKLTEGVYALNAAGLPEEIGGLEELLQNIRLRLQLPLGRFPYGRRLGSRLYTLSDSEEHPEARARALAEEALISLPSVAVRSAELSEDAITFTLETPLGGGRVTYQKGGDSHGTL